MNKTNYYLTGDTHGQFGRLGDFVNRFKTSVEKDVMIILGDAGVNFSGPEYDVQKKEYLKRLPLKLFCIHGNHEMRPESINSYQIKEWNGGKVYFEPEYPNILFAKDGEIYNLNGKKCIVLGGAYSVDKHYRLARGLGWFEDEQPSDEIKAFAEKQLDFCDWKVDVVLSHTVPLKYEPVECFLSCIDQSKVDKTTEQWLDSIEDKLDYQKWLAGHYHIEKKIDRLEILFENYETLDEI